MNSNKTKAPGSVASPQVQQVLGKFGPTSNSQACSLENEGRWEYPKSYHVTGFVPNANKAPVEADPLLTEDPSNCSKYFTGLLNLRLFSTPSRARKGLTKL